MKNRYFIFIVTLALSFSAVAIQKKDGTESDKNINSNVKSSSNNPLNSLEQAPPKKELIEIYKDDLSDNRIDTLIKQLKSYLPSPADVYFAKHDVLGEIASCVLNSAMYEIPCYPRFLNLMTKLKNANLKLNYEYEPVYYYNYKMAHMNDIRIIVGLIGESIAISKNIHLTNRLTQLKNPQSDDLIKLSDGFAEFKDVIFLNEDYILNSIFASDFLNDSIDSFLGLIPFIKNGLVSPKKLFSCKGSKADVSASLIDFLNLAYDYSMEVKGDNGSSSVLDVYKKEIPDALKTKGSSNWIPQGYERFQKDKEALEVVKDCHLFKAIKKYDE